MKLEPTVSSETSAIRTHDAGELPKKEQITFRTRRKLKNEVVTLFTVLVMSQALTDKFNWTAFWTFKACG